MNTTPVSLPEFIEGASGVIYDLPDDNYRAAPGVSNSMLKRIAPDGYEPGSPAHFIQEFADPQTDTDALFIGRMVHARILTPDSPLPGVVAIPETYTAEKGEVKPWHAGAKACRLWLEQQTAKGLRPMKQHEIEDMDGIVNAIANEETCQRIFREGKPEVSCFNTYFRGMSPILRKCRIDWVPARESALCDIKTCQDARSADFARVVFRRRYFVQAAYYLDLWNELNPADQRNHFVFIAVEKFAPYAIQIFDLSPEDIEEGRWEYRRNLATIIECLALNCWPGYCGGVQPLKMRPPFGAAVINE